MKKVLFIPLFLFTLISNAQVLINEVSSNNKTGIKDQFNEYSDWIELFNTSSSPQNLSSYYLSDEKDSLNKWHLGNLSLESNKHLLIYSSGKNIPFSTSVEKTLDVTNTNYYSYADITDESGLGGSTISPSEFTEILGNDNGKHIYAGSINLVDNTGPGDLGYSYAGFLIKPGEWSDILDYSEYNLIRIKASISSGKTLQLRIIQDGINSWEGFRYNLTGTGSEKEYLVPLINNAFNVDFTETTGIQFEANNTFGTIEFRISEIELESRATIPSLSEKHYAYTDESANGNSSISPFLYTSIGKEVNGYNSISATIDYQDNTPLLAYSYATIQTKIIDWDDSLNLIEYDFLAITANIEKDKNIRIALYQHNIEDHTAYGKTLVGSGKDSTYLIPLKGNVSLLDLTQIKSIAIEGTLPYGPRSFTIHKMELQKKIGLNEGHTNFKLSASGETIYLTDGNLILDSLKLNKIGFDMSYGRSSDGAPTFGLFETPTPNSTNLGNPFSGYCADSIEFNLNSGFYPSQTEITISGSSIIHYTLDGSTPTSSSLKYLTPLLLDTTTVVKAACFSNNTLSDKTITATYIINETTHLPVFSISTNPDNFFSDEKGILADGPGWTEEQPHFGANYWEDWEIPAHMQFFDEYGDLQLAQDIGVKVFGGWSRAHLQKSMKLIADKDYGDNDFDYQFFKHKNINSFKHIVLRNSGNDFNSELIHDAINHVTTRGIDNDLDYLEYQPAVVYLNGQYWGIMNIREKINEHYIKGNHGFDSDEVEIYDSWGQDIHNGSTEKGIYDVVYDAQNNDMTNNVHYNNVTRYMDVENLIDFFSINTYISNWDWPQNNLKFWRPIKDSIGQFRYIFFDTDITLGKFGIQSAEFNQIERILTDDKIGPNALIFSELTKNTAFRNKFINRSADMMNTILNKTNYNLVIDSLIAYIAPEVPKHSERWERHDTWEEAFQSTRAFLDKRDSAAWVQMKDQFNLPSIHNVALSTNDNTMGKIKINTISPTLPWNGDYFESVPITLIAQPYLGFTFDYWETSNGLVSTDTLTIDLLKNEAIIAHFNGSSIELSLTVSEINYNSSDDLNYGDYVEIYNNGLTEINLGNYTLKDDKDYHTYSIPENTILQPNEYLVLAEFPALITTKISQTNVLGGFDFGFGSKGDDIRIFNNYNQELINMRYDNKSPWPTEPNGLGYTLENIDLKSLDLSNNENWEAGCYGGSPGIVYDPICLVGTKDQIVSKTNIYPNPVNSLLHLNLNGENYSFNIISIEGITMLNGEFKSGLDVSSLKNGSYIIKIHNKSESYFESFVKL